MDERTRRGKRWTACFAALIALLLLLPTTGTSAQEYQQSPHVTGLNQPVALAFIPGTDDLYITEKDGALKFFDGADTSTALDLTGAVCTESERGLIGVAVDPRFNSNRFVYLYHTAKVGGGGCDNRVSRFVADNTGKLESEKILLDKIGSPCGNHNGGDLQFAGDETLYVSVGDGGCNPKTARSKATLNGKILRITREGVAPNNNPFTGKGTVNCARTGKTSQGKVCREIFALGFRNPFRIAFNGPGKLLYINDVGQNTWEEIDRGIAGANYGWNQCEGFKVFESGKNCRQGGKAFRKLTEPVYAYNHSSGLISITGGAFLPNAGPWPTTARGDYVFADLAGGLYLLEPAGKKFKRTTMIENGNSPISLTIGPDAALYYTSIGAGQVRRVTPAP